MSLLTAIQTAGSALQSYSLALSADQTNVANAATPGYAALRAVIQPVGNGGQGGADRVVLTSEGDSRTDSLVRDALSASGASQTGVNELSQINQLFDITGASGILQAFQKFSTAFANASVNPNDSTLRSIALSSAGSVAVAFNAAAKSLSAQKARVDGAIGSTFTQINKLATQIAAYNAQILRDPNSNPAADAGLRSALDSLSSLVDIGVSTSSDGTVSVLAGGQQPMVIGDQSFTLSVNPAAPSGSQVTSSGGGSSPASFSGQLGSLLSIRSQTISSLLGGNGSTGQINSLAKGFAVRVNALLSSGVTASGGAGIPIFTFDSSNDANVAQTLSVDPAISPDQLALASTGSSAQSNGVANQLSQLPGSTQPADQISGLSATGYFAFIAATVGQSYSDAQTQSSSDAGALTAAQASRTQVSGVSLDQEAVSITSYERAYQASAKIVSVLDQLTSDEVNLIK